MPKTPDDEWRTASILTGALWVAGALDRTDPEMVQKVQLALRYTREAGQRPDDPLADHVGGS
jgi:hypothetical protein